MRTLSVLMAIVMLLFSTGCSISGADVGASRTTNSNGTSSTTVTVTIHIHRALQQAAKVDVINAASQTNVSLFDVPAGLFPPDTSKTPQAILTITTDNGLTFSQTFNMIQVDASPYGAGATGTQTYAYTPQDPSAVASFVQSAANQAVSTVSFDMQANGNFVDPQDGNNYTMTGRGYDPTESTFVVGSVSYASFGSSGGGRCTTRICPNQ